MTKILVIFGTRPEAIKMAPLIKSLNNNKSFDCKVCVTGQHNEMLHQVLKIFDINPNFDLNVMSENQSLYSLTSKILLGLEKILDEVSPDILLVHGDTTSTLTGSLAGYYAQIPVMHVEAGLRTNDIYSPWPEEINRRVTAIMTAFHFAPTDLAKSNLINEGINSDQILVTGNTVIDALFLVLEKIKGSNEYEKKFNDLEITFNDKRTILVTGHRRENFGQGFENICNALKNLADARKDIQIVYPVHLNPSVLKPVNKLIGDVENIKLIEPLDYESFVYLMNQSYLILTDSGGIQEEAPSLGKPVLVMRNNTERPEALEAGTVELVGTNREKIFNKTISLLDDTDHYSKVSKSINPYGDGKATARIVKKLEENLSSS